MAVGCDREQMYDHEKAHLSSLQWPPDAKDSYKNNSKKMGKPKRHIVMRNIRKSHQGIFKTSQLPLMLIVYIISSRSLVFLISAGSHLEKAEKLRRLELPFISMVDAEPSPEPSPARTATSGSYRLPPINGSMFGKRSVNGKLVGGTRAHYDGQSSQIGSTQQKPTALLTTNELARAKFENEPRMGVSRKDTITDIIENFLVQNNENNPDIATVSFCRMIVYECNQVLAVHGRRAFASRN